LRHPGAYVETYVDKPYVDKNSTTVVADVNYARGAGTYTCNIHTKTAYPDHFNRFHHRLSVGYTSVYSRSGLFKVLFIQGLVLYYQYRSLLRVTGMPWRGFGGY
jgi:hypothetical protein